MTEARRFSQVDVFSAEGIGGNPVAVVIDADGLSEAQMADFAKWTNLSETTFVLSPTEPGADYRLRIFTPQRELPFAGHPTLGSAHAWLAVGGTPAGELIVQECGVGLVRIRRTDRLAFAAPDLLRSGPVDPDDLHAICAALRIDGADVMDAAWVDNGPGWVAVRLRDAEAVLALRPDFTAFDGFEIGAVGVWPAGHDAQVEVRAFTPGSGIAEDPVTGSLNASLGQWLAGTVLPASYVAAQGTALGRRGRVHVAKDPDGAVWVGGDTHETITGHLHLPR